ncbi:MAG: hypothetical protein MJ200_04195 [Mycoplasmoidaceae bacterium]|nr:hypothetical protein [Mycoplasmoidaceae bacterium]
MVNFLGSESDKDHDRYNIEKLSYTLTKVTASDDLFGEYATFRISFKMTITGKIKNSGITLEFNNRKAVATNIPVYVRYSSSQVDI